MDDDMEDEIICEIITAHFHLIWKYVSITSSSFAELILPRPGESFKSKMSQPGPFMLLTFVIIISSIILQTKNNWLQKALLSCHKTININVVAEQSLKSLITASIGSDNITQDLTEGIVGVFALQGRRGNMEDRFSVMQEVDVGGSKKLSFYGVYDGHGGQFVAEYVKQNLFINTVEKIRQLRALNEDKLNSNQSKINKEDSVDTNNKIQSSLSSSNTLSDKPVNGKERKLSTSSSLDGNSSIVKDIVENRSTSGKEEKTIDVKPVESGGMKKEEEKTGSQVEEITPKESCEIKRETNYKKDELCIPSLKKEDLYSTIGIKKRNSMGNSNDISSKDSEPKIDTAGSCIDVNSNVNYTKLLTDQIMDIDKKVVDFCKTKTDLSGTTAVIAVIDGELLIIGNVGDSRAVMGDVKGSTIPLSFDHKPNQLKERRRIKEAGGFITFTGVWRVAGILATSRALGDFPLKDPRKLITAEPDVLTFSLKDHKAHFVILATDGLWDVMSNEEAVAFVRAHIHESDYGARSLVHYAYERGSQDNITVLILNLSKLSL